MGELDVYRAADDLIAAFGGCEWETVLWHCLSLGAAGEVAGGAPYLSEQRGELCGVGVVEPDKAEVDVGERRSGCLLPLSARFGEVTTVVRRSVGWPLRSTRWSACSRSTMLVTLVGCT